MEEKIILCIKNGDRATLMSYPIDLLELDNCANNRLKRAGIHTIGDLLCLTEKQFISIKTLTPRTIKVVNEKLNLYDLNFTTEKEFASRLINKMQEKNKNIQSDRPESDGDVEYLEENNRGTGFYKFQFVSEQERAGYKKTQNFLDRSIASLDFGRRVTRILNGYGIDKLGDLIEMGENEIRNIKGLGEKSIYIINKTLKDLGLRLGMKSRSEVVQCLEDKINSDLNELREEERKKRELEAQKRKLRAQAMAAKGIAEEYEKLIYVKDKTGQ